MKTEDKLQNTHEPATGPYSQPV